MYLRAAHVEKSIPVLRQLIRDYPLGILTTAIQSTTYPLLQSSHIPFLLDVQDESSETELGRLRGHMARQNPQSKAIIESLTSSAHAASKNVLEQEVLVLFNADPQHYVTPKFYVETKPSTGKVVPTWNYAAVQAYGKATVYFDADSEETASFLSKQISDLSQYAETSIMGYTGADGKPKPWGVSDAPDRYVELLRRNIIGIDITIERLEGKFKMSQEMGKGDRDGVVQGFEKLESEIGRDMAGLVRQRGELKDAGR
ncbi:putative transcriptional regulator [Xylogone sp. PMI_703]|nr:putative transcriptional regulator [Xylogone sp. PMI_703]